MKRFSNIAVLMLTLLCCQAFANKIDDLKTDADVAAFIKSLDPQFQSAKSGKFSLHSTELLQKNLSCSGIFADWKIKNWEKVDITNDGNTDLVFIANWYEYVSYACIDKGDNSFRLIAFSRNPFDNCELVKPIKIGEVNHLRFFRKVMEPDSANKIPFSYIERAFIDTLTFKFNGFVELGTPVLEAIESIEINTSHCYGTCPSFTLKLYPSGKADFNGIGYTKTLGRSVKRLPKNVFKELSEIANYINVKTLSSHYQVPWTDDQTATLTVGFRDGSKKVITDYGLQGTFGLNAIYARMLDIGRAW